MGLNKNIRLRRINSDRQIIQCHLHNIVTDLRRVIRIIRQRLRICDHNKNLVKLP